MCLRKKKVLTSSSTLPFATQKKKKKALYLSFFLVFSVELTKKIDTLISLKMCSNPFVNNLNIL